MAIGRGSMRQQITKGPQKRKFIKLKRPLLIFQKKPILQPIIFKTLA